MDVYSMVFVACLRCVFIDLTGAQSAYGWEFCFSFLFLQRGGGGGGGMKNMEKARDLTVGFTT